jgi:hypothetical protein
MNNSAGKAKVAMRDADGNIQLVAPALAEKTARRTGWGHVWRAGGALVERGFDGMLFRLIGGEWEPTGLRCLGEPLSGTSEVTLLGVQRDPSGHPWYATNEGWERSA